MTITPVKSSSVSTHFEVLRLLPELQHVLAVEFTLTSVVVLDLVLQLRLVLQANQVHAQFLQGLQLPVLQFLHGLVMADQHGVLHLFLGLLLVQLLGRTRRKDGGMWGKEREGDIVYSVWHFHIQKSIFLLQCFKLRALSTAEESINIAH